MHPSAKNESFRRSAASNQQPETIHENEVTDDKQVSFSEQVTIQPIVTSEPPRSTSVPSMYENASAGASEEDVTYRERLGGYLHPRDMRRLVTPFSASNEPDLIVRRHVMLLNFDPLRAIILRDRLLVLVPEGADSILIKLEQRVRGGLAEVENSVFGSPSEAETGNNDDSSSVRAEEGSSRHMSTFVEKFIKRSDSSDSTSDEIRDSSHSKKGSSPKNKVLSAIKKSVHKKKHDDNKYEDFTFATAEDEEDEMYNEWQEMNKQDWISLPFELQCADAVLHTVCSILSEDTYDLQESALDYIGNVLDGHQGLMDDPLTGIRHTKDAIREMGSRVKGFVQSMNRILDDDEDMALMNLSRLISHPEKFIKPVTPEELEKEADEPELILEAHLQIGLTLMNTLDLIQGQIDTASELVDQKLDSVRNRILFANMIISVFSLCVGTASMVGSIFGMNVLNYLEDSENAFKIITTSTLVGAFTLMVVILGSLIYTGTIPLPGVSGSSL